jgi:hypothetical protein
MSDRHGSSGQRRGTATISQALWAVTSERGFWQNDKRVNMKCSLVALLCAALISSTPAQLDPYDDYDAGDDSYSSMYGDDGTSTPAPIPRLQQHIQVRAMRYSIAVWCAHQPAISSGDHHWPAAFRLLGLT